MEKVPKYKFEILQILPEKKILHSEVVEDSDLLNARSKVFKLFDEEFLTRERNGALVHYLVKLLIAESEYALISNNPVQNMLGLKAETEYYLQKNIPITTKRLQHFDSSLELVYAFYWEHDQCKDEDGPQLISEYPDVITYDANLVVLQHRTRAHHYKKRQVQYCQINNIDFNTLWTSSTKIN